MFFWISESETLHDFIFSSINSKFVSLPYCLEIIDNICKVLWKWNINVVYKGGKTMKCILLKTGIQNNTHNNCVYTIPCEWEGIHWKKTCTASPNFKTHEGQRTNISSQLSDYVWEYNHHLIQNNYRKLIFGIKHSLKKSSKRHLIYPKNPVRTKFIPAVRITKPYYHVTNPNLVINDDSDLENDLGTSSIYWNFKFWEHKIVTRARSCIQGIWSRVITLFQAKN